jgi:hypothetical protein
MGQSNRQRSRDDSDGRHQHRQVLPPIPGSVTPPAAVKADIQDRPANDREQQRQPTSHRSAEEWVGKDKNNERRLDHAPSMTVVFGV